jgi:hypothetical protein
VWYRISATSAFDKELCRHCKKARGEIALQQQLQAAEARAAEAEAREAQYRAALEYLHMFHNYRTVEKYNEIRELLYSTPPGPVSALIEAAEAEAREAVYRAALEKALIDLGEANRYQRIAEGKHPFWTVYRDIEKALSASPGPTYKNEWPEGY